MFSLSDNFKTGTQEHDLMLPENNPFFFFFPVKALIRQEIGQFTATKMF